MSIAQTLEGLRHKGAIPQTTTLDFRIHNINPRNWVMIKSWRDQRLTPQWEGPFQVLFTTESAVQTAEWGWTHANRVKGPVEEPKEWTVTSRPGETRLTLKQRLRDNQENTKTCKK